MAQKIKFNLRKDFREQTRLFRGLTVTLRAKLIKLFKKYRLKLSRDYRRLERIPESYFSSFSEDLNKIMSRHYRVCIEEQDVRMRKIRFKQEEPLEEDIEEYIRTLGLGQVTLITNSTRTKVLQVLRKGLEEGKSIRDISKDLEKSVAFNSARATRIARTETHSAMSYGSHKVAGNLGLDRPLKKWMPSGDDRVRDWHREMSPKPAIPIDDDFIVRGQPMSYAGDPRGGALNVINCRCFIAYYDAEDEIT